MTSGSSLPWSEETSDMITHKKQSYARCIAGDFGNMLRQFRCIEDALKERATIKQFVLRMASLGGGGGRVRYNMSAQECIDEHAKWVAEGVDPRDIVCNEAAPDQDVIFQGEISQVAHCGYGLTYSTVRAHMRPALLERSEHINSPSALLLVRSVMDEASYENLHRLFEAYPMHAIEFSTYRRKLGSRKWNTLFWEVRAF